MECLISTCCLLPAIKFETMKVKMKKRASVGEDQVEEDTIEPQTTSFVKLIIYMGSLLSYREVGGIVANLTRKLTTRCSYYPVRLESLRFLVSPPPPKLVGGGIGIGACNHETSVFWPGFRSMCNAQMQFRRRWLTLALLESLISPRSTIRT